MAVKSGNSTILLSIKECFLWAWVGGGGPRHQIEMDVCAMRCTNMVDINDIMSRKKRLFHFFASSFLSCCEWMMTNASFLLLSRFFFFYSFSCSVWWLRERCLAAKRKPLHWPPSSCGSKSARPKLDSHTSVVPVLSSRWVVLVDALSRSKKTTGQIRIDFFFASSFGKGAFLVFPYRGNWIECIQHPDFICYVHYRSECSFRIEENVMFVM